LKNNWQSVATDLRKICPDSVAENVDLKTITRWKIGGIAPVIVEPSSTEELVSSIRYVSEKGLPQITVGDCSNLLFDDGELDALIIKIGSKFSKMKAVNTRIVCESGIWVPHLVRKSAVLGLGGLQHAVGIPGTLGGLIFMNGGSQRKGIADHLIDVTWISAEGDIRKIERHDCDFGYRSSIFQRINGVIAECSLELSREAPDVLRREMINILRSRRHKFPIKLPNCGSVFISNPSLYNAVGPPGKVIEDSGLKGACIGGAQISPTHANFIVNNGNATANDVLSLIKISREAVFERTGCWMDCEVRYVRTDGKIMPAHRCL